MCQQKNFLIYFFKKKQHKLKQKQKQKQNKDDICC